MKRLTWLGLLCCSLLFATSGYAQQLAKAKTNSGKTTRTDPGALNMRGVYQIMRQVVNNGSTDSLINVQQVKMYTDRHMVYVHPAAPDDSLAVYGVGTYTIENGKVIEHVFYTSDSGAVKADFELSIKKLPGGGYSQVINFPDPANNRTFVLTEDYKRIDAPVTSPIDGAWKQTKRVSISPTGDSSIINDPVQFKFYQAGNYVWVNTSKDSASGKPVSFYGYGTYKMAGKDQLVENTASSSFASVLVGKPVTLQIKMMGNDAYQQTILWPNGARETEYYQRM